MDWMGQMLCVEQPVGRYGWEMTPLVRAGSEVRFLLAAPALSGKLRNFLTRNFSVALVERWFCNTACSAQNTHQIPGVLRFPRPLAWEIPEAPHDD